MKSPARRKLLKKASHKRVRKNVRVYSFYVVGGIVLSALIIGGLAYGAQRPEVTITSVRVEGAEVADTQNIESRAKSALEGSYLFIFPKANTFLYPKSSIARDVLTSDTRLKNADVSRSGTEIVVSVSEHTPAYLWCDTTEEKTSDENAGLDEKCFFANDEGYIFAEAPSFSGHVYVTFRGPLYGEGTDPRGKRYVPVEQFKKILQLLSLVSEQNIIPQSVRAMGSGDYAIAVKEGPEVKFSITQDEKRLSENLAAAISALTDKTSPEYIDLRFGNKVFYK